MLGLGSIIGVGASLVGGIFGAAQSSKARRLERNLVRPEAEVNANLQENALQAEQMASIGLPQQQYTNALQNIQRNQNAGFRQVANRAGIGSIASLTRASNDATTNLDVTDANARLQNQQLAMQQRGVLAQEENRVWDWNERQKYSQQLQQIQQLRSAGQQNMFGALGNIASMGMSGGLGGMFGGNRATVPQGVQGQTMGVTSPTQMPLGLPTGGFQTTL